jgi:hypothetical protein
MAHFLAPRLDRVRGGGGDGRLVIQRGIGQATLYGQALDRDQKRVRGGVDLGGDLRCAKILPFGVGVVGRQADEQSPEEGAQGRQ